MSQPFPRKFYYEEHSYFGPSYLIELAEDKRLYVQETSPCIPFLAEPTSFAMPTVKQWSAFEKKLNSLELMSLNEESLCGGTWVDVWITFRNRVKLSIHLGDASKLRPLHLALNPLTKCAEYPRGLFAKDNQQSRIIDGILK